MSKKIIVISAVNLNVGGTLTILRDCLSYLSRLASGGEYQIIALVHRRSLADYPNIRYIETQWPKKNWFNRLWYEYVSMNKISKQIGPVYLWFSLHDTTPNVKAEKRAVYCHNPYPFHQWKWREWLLSPKIVMFSLFSKYIYRKNIHLNDFVIVQQQWLKDAFKRIFHLQGAKIVVALPDPPKWSLAAGDPPAPGREYTFVYAASPNSHKNFECICKAAVLLKEAGISNFKVYLTISKNDNRYAAWLYKRWGERNTMLHFVGFQNRHELFVYYDEANCLLYPSRVETWGLPISEFAVLKKPMLLADLAYARETAAGSATVAFFDPDKAHVLASQMGRLIQGDKSFLEPVPLRKAEPPVTKAWGELFDMLLSEQSAEFKL